MSARRLLYICSLPHSGSTMFSLFLGTHSKLVGLGGIDRSVQLLGEALKSNDSKKRDKLRCTCGAPATECLYWGAVAKRIPDANTASRAQQYELALDVFSEVFGADAWPVDSSKHVDGLDDIRSVPGMDLRVVHVIKDVRSLTASFIDQARKNKAKTRPAPLLAVEYFWRWRRENGKIDGYLSSRNVPTKRVGYEEVCLNPEVIMGAISGFLGVPKEEGSLDFHQSKSHLIVGNRMRAQEEKQKLRYDHRWFARRDWLLAALLFPQILRYNTRTVYSNQSDALWAH